MVNLKFGSINFRNVEEYYVALGIFCNNKAFSISYEPNKRTGSYSDAYRMRKLASAKYLIKPIEDALRSGNRINCNRYVSNLIDKHNFVQNGKVINGILENVIKTVPEKFVSLFIEGYIKNSINSDNAIVVYETENIKDTATTLKKVNIPKNSRATNVNSKKNLSKRTKNEYIKEYIKNTDIGQRGEKLVFELEKTKLKSAVKEGRISSMDKLLEWVSLENDSAGYDILSYDVDSKQPIYIEVKTTTGTKYTPFYMSSGEVKFSEENAIQYRLYRVYNIKKATAEYFEIKGNISDSCYVQIDATNYLVSLK